MHDSGGPRRARPILERLCAPVWDADKVVLISDHYVPAVDGESAAIMVTGQTWIRLPETIDIDGALPVGVSAKDIMLHLCARPGMGGGRCQAIEYRGDTVAGLSMTERMTLCNRAADLGG